MRTWIRQERERTRERSGLVAGSITVGSQWEQLALEHLLQHGMVELRRNYRSRLGEIDLVMRENDCLVFVEVRYRKHSRYASAAMSVDIHKQRKLARTAALFLGGHPRYATFKTRFDVVAFDATPDDQYRIQWLKDAFRPEN